MRKLRVNQVEHTEVAEAPVELENERKLRVIDDGMRAKVDEFFELSQKISALESKHKLEVNDLKSKLDILKSELIDYGREHELPSISGQMARSEFTSRVSRTIDTKAFLTFLSGHGRTKEFYSFAEIPLTKTIKHFGEAVLESSGVLTSHVKDYAGIKVRPL